MDSSTSAGGQGGTGNASSVLDGVLDSFLDPALEARNSDFDNEG